MTAKHVSSVQKDGNSTPVTSRNGRRTSSNVSRALQPRSENVTPETTSSDKPGVSRKASVGDSKSATTESSAHVVATAECARLAFSYLRSADGQKLSPKSASGLQLETGMLALVARLVALRLDTLAVKELRIVKRRLQAAAQSQDPVAANGGETETLASLLQLEPSVCQSLNVLSLAITYQQLVLKVIGNACKPVTIEAAFEYLSLDQASSPANLIKRLAEVSGDNAKAARQLEALAQTILGLCPSISTTADAAAGDASISPSPTTVFELQTLVLRIRHEWWPLAEHKPDYPKELMEPFSKCLTAFARRSAMHMDNAGVYQSAEAALTSLSLNIEYSSDASFQIFRTMVGLAEKAANYNAALKWAEKMGLTCISLGDQHAQSLACLVKHAALRLKAGQGAAATEGNISAIVRAMGGQLSGHTADYDFLLVELAQLVRVVAQDGKVAKNIVSLAASFAQRYTRSYPDKNVAHAQTIILCALRCSKASDEVHKWVNSDAAKIFIQAGGLRTVAEAASTMPLSTAWSTSSSAVALSRILQALQLKAVRAGGNVTVDPVYTDEVLEPMEQAAMLERQLGNAVDLASTTKHHTVLQKVIQNLLSRLSELYSDSEYPVRRVRVAGIALRLCESHPTLVPPHVLKVWLDVTTTTPEDLASDKGLERYMADLQAGLHVARAFHAGSPALTDVQDALCTWQRITNEATSAQALRDRVGDSELLVIQLRSIASYLGMLGEARTRLAVLRLLLRLEQLLETNGDEQIIISTMLSHQYLELGFSEKAGQVLAQADKLSSLRSASDVVKLQLRLAYSEYLLAIDNLCQAHEALFEAKALRRTLPPEQVQRSNRRAYELAHAQGWLLQSKFCLESGASHEALTAAKSAVRLLNSAWASIERSTGGKVIKAVAEPADVEERDDHANAVAGLAIGVSKLQLTPKDREEEAPRNDKGAAFWTVLPIMCRGTLHLSDMYAYHGLYAEANYYSERAVELAESTGSTILLSRTRSHRSRLLAVAGRSEEADLCLTKGAELCSDGDPMAQIDRSCAKASVLAREGSLKEALEAYDDAIRTTQRMQAADFVEHLGGLMTGEEIPAAQTAALFIAPVEACGKNVSRSRPATKALTAKRAPASKAPKKATAARPTNTCMVPNRGETTATEPNRESYLLQKSKRDILLESVLVSLRLGVADEDLLQSIEQVRSATSGSVRQVHVQFQQLMRKVSAALQSDICYNMLPESTLSFPALVRTERRPSEHGMSRPSLLSSPQKTGPSVIIPAKTARARSAVDSLVSLLLAAKDCLVGNRTVSLLFSSTADTYVESSMLSSVSMLLSAAGVEQSKAFLHPVREALYLERPRIHALQCESHALSLENGRSSELFAWANTEDVSRPAHLTSAAFQQQYIDILPRPWTVVSLSLNEARSELYVARYRSGQSPLIIRLPFSRHKQDDEDEEAFDYHKGKAELQEIIQVSNYSCHNTGSIEAKGARSNWWSEREALDKRLHELLINIENIWFGGFKGVFSQLPRQPELLARFRKSMDDILARYLPSRQAAKGRTKPLALDDKILELFIGLGSDQDGVIDLDEPLSDLLYFVVDMFQFNAERNAYDEIDFDSMAVDVLDTLRSYHEACEDASGKDQHLILVLDKRLQAFPWESLPYLENASASRIGSMLSLRQRILAMRQTSDDETVHQAHGCHMVSRKSGTYILNPSTDLTNTESMLSAPLAKLAEAGNAKWTSMVKQVPTEDDFRTALTDTSMMLYFGHGSGAQYIRPRTIRKLDKCSKVVWLMGCSSGAVTEYGELEPSAVPLAYLMAGREDDSRAAESDPDLAQETEIGRCMAVLATLWDVTDKDIDRFSLAVGEEWGLWAPSETSKLPAKTPKKRERLVAPSTSQQVPKTPKTPKARKTPAPTKTPARSRSRPRQEVERKKSLVEAVARSRDACYLRYLNGAAAVVFGVPVYVGD